MIRHYPKSEIHPRRRFLELLALIFVLSLSRHIVPNAKATITLHRVNPDDGLHWNNLDWRGWYGVSTDGTNLYIPEGYPFKGNSRILTLNSSNLGTENPNWTILGETPKGNRLHSRHVVTKDGKWMYGFGYHVPSDGFYGLARINLTNPSVGYAYCTKSDGSSLKHHFYLPSLVEDNQARIYVAEYYGSFNACVWRANIGLTRFSLFRNITADWLSQGYPKDRAEIAHLHSISFNSDFSRLYFAWDKGGGWVDMADNSTTFQLHDSLPKFGEEEFKRLSCVTQQIIFGIRCIIAFSDESWVHAFLLDSAANTVVKYNWINFTTATPYFENPVAVRGDKVLVAFRSSTLDYGQKGGLGYLDLTDGSWTSIHTNGVSCNYFAVRIGNYIYFCAGDCFPLDDERMGLFYFHIADLPLYDKSDWKAFRNLIKHGIIPPSERPRLLPKRTRSFTWRSFGYHANRQWFEVLL